MDLRTRAVYCFLTKLLFRSVVTKTKIIQNKSHIVTHIMLFITVPTYIFLLYATQSNRYIYIYVLQCQFLNTLHYTHMSFLLGKHDLKTRTHISIQIQTLIPVLLFFPPVPTSYVFRMHDRYGIHSNRYTLTKPRHKTFYKLRIIDSERNDTIGWERWRLTFFFFYHAAEIYTFLDGRNSSKSIYISSFTN